MLQEIAARLPSDLQYNIAAYALPIKFAIKHNMVWVFTILEQEDYTKSKAKKAWRTAIKYGRIHILHLLASKKIRYHEQLSALAARYPRLEILKFCYNLKKYKKIHDDEIQSAVRHDNDKNFEYIIQLPSHRSIFDDKDIIDLIRLFESSKILEWVITNFEKMFTSRFVCNDMSMLHDMPLLHDITTIHNNLCTALNKLDKDKILNSVKLELIQCSIKFGKLSG